MGINKAMMKKTNFGAIVKLNWSFQFINIITAFLHVAFWVEGNYTLYSAANHKNCS